MRSHLRRLLSIAPAVVSIATAPLALPAQSTSGASSRAGMVLRVTAAANGAGMGGMMLGYGRDALRCEQRWGSAGERDTVLAWGFSFPPCFLPAGDGSRVGLVAGGVIGGAASAARLAQRRGCSRRAAWTRAIAGAVLGAAPGLPLVLRPPSRWPPRRTSLLFLTPTLSGIGASAATVGCGRPG